MRQTQATEKVQISLSKITVTRLWTISLYHLNLVLNLLARMVMHTLNTLFLINILKHFFLPLCLCGSAVESRLKCLFVYLFFLTQRLTVLKVQIFSYQYRAWKCEVLKLLKNAFHAFWYLPSFSIWYKSLDYTRFSIKFRGIKQIYLYTLSHQYNTLFWVLYLDYF